MQREGVTNMFLMALPERSLGPGGRGQPGVRVPWCPLRVGPAWCAQGLVGGVDGVR